MNTNTLTEKIETHVTVGSDVTPDVTSLSELTLVLRGGGDIATGVALRLHRAGFSRLLILEQTHPLAVRRAVCLSEAVYLGHIVVEDLEAIRVTAVEEAPSLWRQRRVPVLVDPAGACLDRLRPHVVIDATLSKRNIGVTLKDAPLVLGLGPGFTAGVDVHAVVETNRGHSLGRVIRTGSAEPNTGVPGSVNGMTFQRVLRAPCAGVFRTDLDLGAHVREGQVMGHVDEIPVFSALTGLVRGLVRSETPVPSGMKLGDIDPREHVLYQQVSDKALAVGGGVLEAVLARFM